VVTLLAGAAPAAAAPDGARLYTRMCAVCHGDAGDGGVGVPLRLPAFQDSVSDAYLKQTIREGRPGRIMPAFDHLSEAEVNAIVEHIRSWHEGERPEFSQARIAGDAQHGKQLYEQHCAKCHGEQGEGGQGTGVTFSRPRDLPIIAPALNNPGFLTAASDAMIKATLMQGRKGTPMVSFRDQGLSEQDINDLVAYVRSFEQEHTEPPPRTEEIDPILVYDSPYGLEETVEAVERAAVGRNFRLIRRQKLEEGLMPEGEASDREVIVYFCNFNFLYDALTIDPRVGLFLPCRVTVVEQEGQVKVMSINPKRLGVLFNNERLNRACDEMHDLYTAILEEATF
jgi:cytochrome c oxidase cbb3-type subunit 3